MERDKDRLRHQWGIRDQRGATLEGDLWILLDGLCIGGGFCSVGIDDVLAIDEPITAEAFAHAVLLAEGWADPEDEYEFRPLLIRLLTERYGPSVSAKDYRAG